MIYTDTIKKTIVEMQSKGMSSRAIAKVLGISKSGINDFLTRLREGKSDDVTSIDAVYRPKILIYDIETAPSMSYHWRRWKENIGQSQVIREGYMLCWSAKWLGDDNVAFDSIQQNPGKDHEDDSKILMSLVEMMKEADIIVAHNNKRFDLPTVQAYMVRQGMEPLPPMKVVDTLLIAKKNFRFPSNSLDALGQYLGCGQKLQHTGFDLWKRCMANDSEAWDTMTSYNIQDVNLLEEVYMKLRPWDKQHPNLSLYYPNGVMRCPCCASKNIEMTDKLAYTSVSAFETYQCQDCGKYSRTRANLKTKEQRANVLSNVAD